MRRGKHDPWFRLAVTVVEPLLSVATRRDWRGAEHVPPTGGIVVVTNHLSHVDPLTFGHFLYAAGRTPRFLAKDSLFRAPVVGHVVRGAGQIPVLRETSDARLAYAAAVDAVRRGEAVCIYPEATLTRDPDLWPMAGKTGAARVALATGAPVVPVAQWGAQDLLAPYARLPRLFPRPTVHIVAGPPVDLTRYEGRQEDPAALREVTDLIMADVTALLEQLRGARAPAVRFDPRDAALPLVGDPRRRRPRSGRRQRGST